jgi:hypothetical protein
MATEQAGGIHVADSVAFDCGGDWNYHALHYTR